MTLATSKRTAATRQERVAEKEVAILNAAREVFVAHGFERARIAEIAQRARIAEGTIYIYYKTKNDLMQAVVQQFWDRITRDAASAINPKTSTFDQLRALAKRHLTMMSRDREYIDLEVILRNSGTEPIASDRTMVKRYVAVFDTVFQQGQNRGDLDPEADIWMARDLFYGTLDYSARTMTLRGAKRSTAVVDNLIATLRARYELTEKQTPGTSLSLAERLESAIDRIEQIAGK